MNQNITEICLKIATTLKKDGSGNNQYNQFEKRRDGITQAEQA